MSTGALLSLGLFYIIPLNLETEAQNATEQR